MQKFKSSKGMLMIALMFLCVSACAPKKNTMVADIDASGIKDELEKGGASAKVWIEKPNNAVSQALTRGLSSDADVDKAGKISAFLEGMGLSKELDDLFVSEMVFDELLPGNRQDLNVVLSYGLSDDLQVAGLHGAVSFSSHASKGKLTKCVDQFEMVAHSRISDQPEPFLGRDVRLINHYFRLQDLYRSMASDVASLIQRYYFRFDEFDFSKAARPLDVITYDQRVYENVASITALSKVIAIKHNPSADPLCKSVHLITLDQADVRPINDSVSLEKADRRREASKKKFQYQQSERNRALMYQRMRDRVINK